jgi:LmbE family N-acetylglucosaminyl deacetylase
MKPTSNSTADAGPLLVFGAHPDDIEFGCGAVVARESQAGRSVHFIVCSRGEAATHGTPAERLAEAEKAAALLGATLEFVELDGDAQLEIKAAHTVMLAKYIRRHQPAIVLAPTLVENQHPDHGRLGRTVRDAARLARYGGLAELQGSPAHAIDHLLYYAVTPNAEPTDTSPLLFDVSSPEIIKAWSDAMATHTSQAQTRNYVELQLTRARFHGLRAGVEHAIPLWPNDPLIFSSLASLERSARRY